MKEFNYTITDPAGIHARPAGLLVKKTQPYASEISLVKDGKTGKPFLLPQKEADYYAGLMKSYNIPEFVTGKVTNRSYQIRRLAEQGGISVSCSTF